MRIQYTEADKYRCSLNVLINEEMKKHVGESQYVKNLLLWASSGRGKILGNTLR